MKQKIVSNNKLYPYQTIKFYALVIYLFKKHINNKLYAYQSNKINKIN